MHVDHGLVLTVRGAGHSIASLATFKGGRCSLSPKQIITVDSAARRVWVN